TLKQFITDRPMGYPEVGAMVILQVCRALAHAHAGSILHRDVKPENVMIRDDGLIKLMDFGIAQIVDKERMTVTGQLLGSPAYMAPEHVEGRPLDFRTDVFALGILLYQLATGQLPFRGKNPHEVLKRIAECTFIAPERINPLIGARLARVIGHALKRLPAERFPDVSPLRQELLEDLADAGIDDPRRELAAFFADPKKWTAAFRPRLIESLAARGGALARAGRTAAALELWSRALSIEPRSPELRALVDGVARRRRLSRVALVGLCAIAIGGATTLGVRSWLARPRPAPIARASVRPAPSPTAIVHPAAIPTRPAPIVPKEAIAKPIEHAAPRIHHPLRPAAQPVLRTVDLVPYPRAIHVWIDGVDKGDYTDGKYAIDDRPHSFRLECLSNACFPKTVQVAPEQSHVDVRLEWRPAYLTLVTQPPGADVLVAGLPAVYNDRQPIAVEIPAMSDDGRRTVQVTISPRDKHFVSQTLALTLRAGQSLKAPITLAAAGAE
ncbi:MAG TPA: protein kinase, partial [Polyangia bacterium]